MLYVQVLRDEAERYRDLAKHAGNTNEKKECEDLAEVIEEVAAEIEDKMVAG